LDIVLLPEPTVHASYTASATEGRHCLAMDAFFSRLVSNVSKGGDRQRLRDALEYMTHLDKLAKHEGNAEDRWFDEVEVLANDLARFTQEEVTASFSNSPAIGVRSIAIKPTKKETSQQHLIHSKVFGPRRHQTLNGGETYQYELTRRLDKADECLDVGCLTIHLQDDAILAHIDDSRAELVREHMQEL
jgi:hypothetical protein